MEKDRRVALVVSGVVVGFGHAQREGVSYGGCVALSGVRICSRNRLTRWARLFNSASRPVLPSSLAGMLEVVRQAVEAASVRAVFGRQKDLPF